MSKILYNVTASPIVVTDTGLTIPAMSSYTIPPQDYLLWAASGNAVTFIGNLQLVVNDGSQNLNISEGVNLIKGYSINKIIGASDGTPIGNTSDRLKVEAIITSNSAASSYTSKLRYIDMNNTTGGVARNTVITNATWVDTFSYYGSGLLSCFILNLEDSSNWNIRLLVDGEEVFGSLGLYTNDIASDAVYDLDSSGKSIDENAQNIGIFLGTHERFIWNGPLNIPITYTSSVIIKVKRSAGEASKKFRAGFIVLTKET